MLGCERFTTELESIVFTPSIDNNYLLQIYLKKIPLKIRKLFKKWMYLDTIDGFTENNIVEYFEQNNQCKLSWFLDEITSAIQVIYNIASG